jgi:hypothetical protein
MAEWVLFQNEKNRDRMGAAVFTSGPYIEMVISPLTPMTPSIEDGVVTWRVPLGEGAVPHVSLEDCGFYVRWLFDHPERANGMDLEVAIEHMTYADMAAAFEKVTGHQAQYIDTDLDTYWSHPDLTGIADHPALSSRMKPRRHRRRGATPKAGSKATSTVSLLHPRSGDGALG